MVRGRYRVGVSKTKTKEKIMMKKKVMPLSCLMAAPSWRATNGRPYILYIAKSMFFDMLFLLYLLCSKTQGSLRPSTYRFFPDFIFFFIIFLVFLLTLPYPHPIVMV